MTGSTAPVPFPIRITEEALEDLRARVARTRLPAPEAVDPAARGRDRWRAGMPVTEVVRLLAHWRQGYDWRRVEEELNAAGSILVHLGASGRDGSGLAEGVDIHVLHRRSPRADARPLLLTHGWPGSVVEFLDVVGPLVDPGDPEQPAFHVVVPSLPGFGFSGAPTRPGWGVERIAGAWAELMTVLGYDRFLAHGGDWGGLVTTVLAARHPDRVVAMHTTFPQPPPGLTKDGLTRAELEWVEGTRDFHRVASGYALQQAHRPQTLGYALVDSPVGLLTWIVDKVAEWTDNDGDPFAVVDRDRVLDGVSLYWFTGSAASAARIYAESYGRLDPELVVDVPAAITVYPREIERYPRSWLARRYRDIVRWSTPGSGGHFPALEQPAGLVDELRAAFAGPSMT